MSARPRLEVYREQYVDGPSLAVKLGGWRWRFVSNGHIMGDGGQAYRRRTDCLAGSCRVLGGWLRDDYGREFVVRWRRSLAVPTLDSVPVVDLTRADR